MKPLAALLAIVLAGCSTMSNFHASAEVLSRPSHTCTGFVDCFAQLWVKLGWSY